MEGKLRYTLDLDPSSRWNILSSTAAARSALLYAQETGDFLAGPEYYTARQGTESWLIKLTLSGCGELRYGGRTYRVPAGHFFWIDCREEQYYRTEASAGQWHVVWVHFNGANARFYYESFLRNNAGEPVAALPTDAAGYGAMQALLALSPSENGQMERDLRAAELLTRLLTSCLLSAMDRGNTRNLPQPVREICVYLMNHSERKHTLEELGARFNMSACHLQKVFKRYVGQSPTEYLICQRMLRAKELMRTTRKPISEIAQMVGMSNVGFFSRQFKQQEGLTPQEYRKLWPAYEKP